MKVLIDQAIIGGQALFAQQAQVETFAADTLSAEQCRDSDALIVRSVTPVKQSLLEGSRIKFVATASAGFDHLDIAYLQKQGIAWSAAPGCNAIAVAEYVLLVLLALQQQQKLKAQPKIAIIGVGQTGSRVAQYCQALKCPTILYDPPRARCDKHFSSATFEEIFTADVISLHVPLCLHGEDKTYHLIDKAFTDRCTEKTVIINASRGDVLDEAVLTQSHLQFCLDTWANEPNINLQMLFQVEIATPHIAGHSIEAKQRALHQVYQAFCRCFSLQCDHKGFIGRNVNIDFNEKCTWQTLLLDYFNPKLKSEYFIESLQQSTNPENTFKIIRKQMGERHELALIASLDQHLPFSLLKK